MWGRELCLLPCKPLDVDDLMACIDTHAVTDLGQQVLCVWQVLRRDARLAVG